MRKDMAKLLLERPRIVESLRRHGRAKDVDWLPKDIGLYRNAQEAGGRKYFGEYCAPLARYLSRRVGRTWNKVYSEICADLDVRSTTQQHVRDHLHDFVELHPSDDLRVSSWSDQRWRQPYYVDARDGLLKPTDRTGWAKAMKRQAARKAAPADRLPLNAGHELRCVDGVWYLVDLAPPPPNIAHRARHLWEAPPGEKTIRKRQLSRSELRRHGLSNAR